MTIGVVSHHSAVDRQGGFLVATRSFNCDHAPILHVYEDHFHCFTCGAHGDAVDYEMHASGVDFDTAVVAIGSQEGGASAVEWGRLRVIRGRVGLADFDPTLLIVKRVIE